MNKYSVLKAGMPLENEKNIDRILELIYCLYGMKYKEEKSLNTRINGFMARAFSTNAEDNEIRKAISLVRKVSATFSLNDAPPLTWGDVREFKTILEGFAYEIAVIISDPGNPYCLATRCFQFKKQWNEVVDIMNGQFLEGFGDICSAELRLCNAQNMTQFLWKLRKAQKVPMELSIFHEKLNQKAINKSIEAYVEFQTRMRSVRKK